MLIFCLIYSTNLCNGLCIDFCIFINFHVSTSGGSAIVVVMAPSSTILILLSLIFSFIHLLYYFFFCVFIFGEELEKRSGLVTRKCVFSPSTVSGHVRIIVM
ncbi:hypothetical protein ACJIZ3_018925 [Penstemon smallii]|uniref:Uncharacterized protein n=1 Tax=Penstemon smallii TaxID=265156 RepID=A0ABD3T0B0_9LAMI